MRARIIGAAGIVVVLYAGADILAYERDVHTWIAQQAAELYQSQYGAHELLVSYLVREAPSGGHGDRAHPSDADEYVVPVIDRNTGTDPSDSRCWDGGSFIEGAYEEDTHGVWMRHFVHGPDDPDFQMGLDSTWYHEWADQLPSECLWQVIDNAASFNKANHDGNYLSAFEAAQLEFDRAIAWAKGTPTTDEFGTTLSALKDMARAYYHLGRVAHLLMDMTVPPHVNGVPHEGFISSKDRYEEQVKSGGTHPYTNYAGRARWSRVGGYGNLEDLFRQTVRYTAEYPSVSDNTDWITFGLDGGRSLYCITSDPVRRDSPLIQDDDRHKPDVVANLLFLGEYIEPENTNSYMNVLAADLLPFAIEQTAALIRLFYKEVYEANATSLPAVPSDMNSTYASASKVILTWKDNADNEAGFNIYAVGDELSYEPWQVEYLIGTVGANVTSFTDTDPFEYSSQNYDTYRFKKYAVYSYNAQGESREPNSSEWLGVLIPIVGEPRNLQAEALGHDSIKLTWTDDGTNAASHFLIGRASSPTDDLTAWRWLGHVDVSDEEYISDGLLANTRYYYRVHPGTDQGFYGGVYALVDAKTESVTDNDVGMVIQYDGSDLAFSQEQSNRYRSATLDLGTFEQFGEVPARFALENVSGKDIVWRYDIHDSDRLSGLEPDHSIPQDGSGYFTLLVNAYEVGQFSGEVVVKWGPKDSPYDNTYLTIPVTFEIIPREGEGPRLVELSQLVTEGEDQRQVQFLSGGSIPRGTGTLILDLTFSTPMDFLRLQDTLLPYRRSYLDPGVTLRNEGTDEVLIGEWGLIWSGASTYVTFDWASLPVGAYVLTLDDSSFVDEAGARLDGEWNGQLPTGDGRQGGDFVYRFMLIGPKATSPNPSSTAVNQPIDADLRWFNSGGATDYDVYFGTDPALGTSEYKGRQASTTYRPSMLEYGTTYYWRIDANSPSGITTGDVWSFTTGVLTRYILTTSVSGSNGIIEPGGTYEGGIVVTLTATPAVGYGIKSWSGTDDDMSRANINTVTMNSDQTVTVEFELIPPDDGLVAHFPFDGDVLEVTGYSNDGVNNGSTDTEDRFGEPNGARHFTNRQYVRVPRSAAIEPADAITVALWARLTDPGYYDQLPILSKRYNVDSPLCNSYILQPNNAPDFNMVGAIIVGGSVVPAASSTAMEPHVWTHEALVYDGTSLKVYQDGQLVAQCPASGSLDYSSDDLYIGIATPQRPLQHWEGDIDDVRIYNRALSASEVQELSGRTLVIGGAVYTDRANPMATGLTGVTMTVTGSNDVYEAVTYGTAGFWHISDVHEGSYTVTPSKSGWVFEHMVAGVSDGQSSTVIEVNDANQATIESIQFLAEEVGVRLHDWNGDGIVSIVGDVPPFVQCVYFGNFPDGVGTIDVGDCNGDGILSIVGDVPCFVQCVYFNNCPE